MNSSGKKTNTYLLMLVVLCAFGCSKKLIWYSKKRNSIESYQHLNDSTLLISGVSTDPQFGFTELKPIMLGIFDVNKGAGNVEKYLNGLRGPNGETITYKRLKPCCPFRTRNFTYDYPFTINGTNKFDGKHGMLEKFQLDYNSDGQLKSLVIFVNLYDETKKLLAPYGLSYKK